MSLRLSSNALRISKSSSSPSPHTPSSRNYAIPSEILPNLWISDLSIAEHGPTLQALGITHVLSAMRGNIEIPHNIHLQRGQIPLEDGPFAELAAHLPASTAFLQDALQHGGRVLVHCAQGVSRSTSVVAGYLIATCGYTPAQALAHIKSKRRVAEPNFGFVFQLQQYAELLDSHDQ